MSNHTDGNEQQGEALKPCPFCGSASVVWSEHFQRVRCNGCFIGTNTVTEPRMPEAHKERCIRDWNTRRASVAAVEGDAEVRAKAIVELVENLKLQHAKRKHHGPFESCTSYSICALANQIAAASSPASPVQPTHPFGPCGYKYCDWPDGELRCNEPRLFTEGNRAEAIRLLRELRETKDPEEIQRQKDSWAQLESYLNKGKAAPLQLEGEQEKEVK